MFRTIFTVSIAAICILSVKAAKLVNFDGKILPESQINSFLQTKKSIIDSNQVSLINFVDCTLRNDGYLITNKLFDTSFIQSSNGKSKLQLFILCFYLILIDLRT